MAISVEQINAVLAGDQFNYASHHEALCWALTAARDFILSVLDESVVMHDDMTTLMNALGIPTHARDASPHEVMVSEIIPAVAEMRTQIVIGPDELRGWDAFSNYGRHFDSCSGALGLDDCCPCGYSDVVVEARKAAALTGTTTSQPHPNPAVAEAIAFLGHKYCDATCKTRAAYDIIFAALAKERERAGAARQQAEDCAELHSSMCGDCGAIMTIVRPGKYQCDACDYWRGENADLTRKLETAMAALATIAKEEREHDCLNDMSDAVSTPCIQIANDALAAIDAPAPEDGVRVYVSADKVPLDYWARVLDTAVEELHLLSDENPPRNRSVMPLTMTLTTIAMHIRSGAVMLTPTHPAPCPNCSQGSGGVATLCADLQPNVISQVLKEVDEQAKEGK